jgi:ribonuclease HII
MSSRPLDPPRLFDLPVGPDFAMELAALRRGLRFIAGCDEAGRGPLAGPVVAAAVVLDKDRVPDGLDDSKKLTAKRRDELFAEILAVADVSVASSSARSIDRGDIRKASLDAMRRALAGLPVKACHALFDGRDIPPGIACPGDAVVKGDARSFSIAAASIVAKVMRDRMMARLDGVYPAYGFAAHAGYATAGHRQAIALVGPCPLHRMSFRPMRPDGF